ncbi:leucyl/phenylalanyl-tRNA--protein transferase [Nigerium massiliense]|uniref:leucyl/phenylalanyl-tRNA--protein transferase n=1 Tax=Nigerium massiliense TaxID=1522317 RepID=UPI000693BDC1|nr:leucyl/phenylalanyl-tRNA--protein transferase [Nigerium massiliense]
MRLSGVFGPVAEWPGQDLVALSHEFDAELVVEAYRAGVFPMPLHEAGWPAGTMGWWSPVHRGILPLDDIRVTRSLRKSARHYTTTVDRRFAEVMERCGDPSRPGGWIDGDITRVYTQLYDAGLAHSVEVWTPDGRLAGGLYGVGLGGLFAGESMFHDPEIGRDASKVALLRLVRVLDDGHERLLDVQWVTDHLATLGAVEVDRDDYLRLLGEALDVPAPDWAAAREDGPHAGDA